MAVDVTQIASIALELFAIAFCVVGMLSVPTASHVGHHRPSTSRICYLFCLVMTLGGAVSVLVGNHTGMPAHPLQTVGNMVSCVASFCLLSTLVRHLCRAIKRQRSRTVRLWPHVANVLIGMAVIACIIQSYYYVTGSTTLACIAGAMVFFASMQQLWAIDVTHKDESLRHARELIDLQHANAANAQVSPHFFGNSLSVVHQLCLTDPSLAATACEALCDFMRASVATLQSSRPIPVESELRNVRAYLELERIASTDRLRYTMHVHACDFVVPPLSVLVLVQNAVQHGLSSRRGVGTIDVMTSSTADGFEVTVSDNGIGFDADVPVDATKHTGIANARFRIEHMCKGSLQVSSVPGKGTTATIRIPRVSWRCTDGDLGSPHCVPRHTNPLAEEGLAC